MEEKLDAILATLQEIQKSDSRIENHINDVDEGLSKDRNDIQNINISNGQVVAELGEVRRAVNLISDKVKNKVADAMEPMMGVTQELTQTLDKKKTLILSPKSLFRRIVDEFKHEVGR